MSDTTTDTPTNATLAQRTTRVEEKIDALGDTLERIEENLAEGQSELEQQVNQNTRRIRPWWMVWRAGKYGLPTAGTLLGALAATGVV